MELNQCYVDEQHTLHKSLMTPPEVIIVLVNTHSAERSPVPRCVISIEICNY